MIGPALAFDEATMPEGDIDQGPERVVVVGAPGKVLGNRPVHPVLVEVGADRLRAVEQPDRVVLQLVAQPLLERQAVALLAPGQDAGQAGLQPAAEAVAAP